MKVIPGVTSAAGTTKRVFLNTVVQEEIEDTKEVIRNRESMKYRKCNSQAKKEQKDKQRSI
jgi:hypothetical protein